MLAKAYDVTAEARETSDFDLTNPYFFLAMDPSASALALALARDESEEDEEDEEDEDDEDEGALGPGGQ